MSRNTHLVLQLCLSVIWVLIIFTDASVTVSSQACTQPDYMWQNPLRKFWRPNFGNVVVKIDSRFATQYPEAPDAVTRISAGHQLWNPQNSGICAGITFTGFGTQAFSQTDYDAEAPAGHVYWQVTDPGSVSVAEQTRTMALMTGSYPQTYKSPLISSFPTITQSSSIILAPTRLAIRSISATALRPAPRRR